jgi:hypothetical protein
MFLHKVIDPVLIPPLLTYNFCLFEFMGAQWDSNSLSPHNEPIIPSFFWVVIGFFCDIFEDLVLKLWSPPPRLFTSQSNGSSKAINHLLLGYNVLIERASRKQGGWTNNTCVVPQSRVGHLGVKKNHPFKICPKENVKHPMSNIPFAKVQRWMK